ncbi:glycoside hydrolase family 68 protein [Glycomyces sp. L485]|uniref:glycoside hydrolase family 68 protein n=1 Tax=Glycomyces sp. L485 TaxID=2909235 RepID=UPI001F4A6BBE|nr:glycoside hydrolase family 68 protein [Glycomyces sp. L485]MCH7231307.1 glycoside hydrolase family 68 protein [Glycomyces sp. L485]
MLKLADHWVWDSWYATDDAGRHHAFFLRASRALQEEERRHQRASIGHAVSDDLADWTLLPDALVFDDGPAWDDRATWTGSVVRGDDGRWRLFYTGVSHADDGKVQRIGSAASDDLITWHRLPGPQVEADARFYEKYRPGSDWFDEACRDPWVFRDPAGAGWHMLFTARVDGPEPARERGVVGHARSSDLDSWEVLPPLSRPDALGFGQIEVPQLHRVDGQWLLLFCCGPNEASDARRALGEIGDNFTVPVEDFLGGFDIAKAKPFAHESLYAARLHDIDGQAHIIGFRNFEDGEFVGEIADPVPVRWNGERLVCK